jgi:type III restriction enzyme
VRLTNDVIVLRENRCYEDDQDRAKQQAVQRWVAAVNHWGQLGRWAFHVCRDPQLLGHELTALYQQL